MSQQQRPSKLSNIIRPISQPAQPEETTPKPNFDGMDWVTYEASDLARDPKRLQTMPNHYAIIRDMSTSGRFDKMVWVLNTMKQLGWRLHTANFDREGMGVAMYAVMERIED